MPLTALYAGTTSVDLTLGTSAVLAERFESASPIRWDDIYKVKPRAPLTCRECGHGLHAKVSRGGMQFFAHDPHAPQCGLAGESLAHRLLKVVLASAIRDSGWHAELEVAGDGWRADVLATSPDGSRRMAWEAQLAAATASDLQLRTQKMAAESVSVCWVTDKDRPFIGHVPSIRIQTLSDENPASSGEEAGRTLSVRDGLGVFNQHWCENQGKCKWWNSITKFWDDGPCAGHGRWAQTEIDLELSTFVAHVLTGTVRLHNCKAGSEPTLGPHAPRPMVWTTQPHVASETEQLRAVERARIFRHAREQTEERRREERARHLAATVSLLARQDALRGPAVDLVGREVGGYVGVRDAAPEWAMGVPLYAHDLPQGVISPVARRIIGDVRKRLSSLTLFVATAGERDRVAKMTVPGQRIVLFEVDVDDAAYIERRMQSRASRGRPSIGS